MVWNNVKKGGFKKVSEARDERVVITVTPEEKKKIEDAARSYGMPMTAYCRYVLLFRKEKE